MYCKHVHKAFEYIKGHEEALVEAFALYYKRNVPDSSRSWQDIQHMAIVPKKEIDEGVQVKEEDFDEVGLVAESEDKNIVTFEPINLSEVEYTDGKNDGEFVEDKRGFSGEVSGLRVFAKDFSLFGKFERFSRVLRKIVPKEVGEPGFLTVSGIKGLVGFEFLKEGKNYLVNIRVRLYGNRYG